LAGLSIIDSESGFDANNDTTVATDGALNIAAGDVLVVYVKWISADTTLVVSDGGSNTFTMSTHQENSTLGSIGYILNAAANAAATFTATFGANMSEKGLIIYQCRPSAGETPSLDGGPSGTFDDGTTPTSGTVSVAGPGGIVFGGAGDYGTNTFSDPLIGGAAADASIQRGGDSGSGYMCLWYKAGSTGSINAVVTISGSTHWTADIIAIKSVGGAGGIVPIIMFYKRMRS
jgi:hypothetical protein